MKTLMIHCEPCGQDSAHSYLTAETFHHYLEHLRCTREARTTFRRISVTSLEVLLPAL